MAGQAAPEAGNGDDDGDDATDPLVQVGRVEERATLLRESNGVLLERVEVWGPAGLGDSFVRLTVAEAGAYADGLRELLLDAPEQFTGFRDLLVRDDCALAAALEPPATDLSTLSSGRPGQGLLPRMVDLLEGLRGIAAFLELAQQKLDWGWATPMARQLAVLETGPREPAGLRRHQLVFNAWDQLGAGRTEAGALITAVAPAFLRLREEAETSGFGYGAQQAGLVLNWLEETAGDHQLTCGGLAARLSQLRPRFAPCSRTDTGRARAHNEDAALLLTMDQTSAAGAELLLTAVADGMGGHQSGEVASSLALDLLRQQLAMGLLAPRSNPVEPRRLGEQLETIIPTIDRALTERAQLEPALSGMGTTMAGLAVLRQQSTLGDDSLTDPRPECAAVFHVGDSRAYLLTADGPRRLTRDHSLVQDLVDSGAISAEEAFSHPQKNVITRCLGGGTSESAPDVSGFTPGIGEVVLLCSDGLTDVLKDEDLWRTVGEAGAAGLPAVAQTLIDAANEGGGPDNITVVLIGCGL